MDAPIGTKAQQTALRNIVAMLTIADSGVNDARRIARYIDSMNNEDELKMALSIAIGMLHSAMLHHVGMGPIINHKFGIFESVRITAPHPVLNGLVGTVLEVADVDGRIEYYVAIPEEAPVYLWEHELEAVQ